MDEYGMNSDGALYTLDAVTAAAPKDTRPNIAGYVLPLSITTDPIMGEDVVDADGEQIINFADEEDGDFFKELIAKVNRAGELEAALVLIGKLYPASVLITDILRRAGIATEQVAA